MKKVAHFNQTGDVTDDNSAPSQKHVARWLWQVDKNTSPIVQAHGQKMLDTYFDTKEAAELFVLHGE
ncbi:hypothetical protein [Shewanella colwelliana]|uniref:hypothetical protein n=1 Tax=Shewanella colwelliana TaxID=23 RepID=UPI0037355836